jgi:hypothetical protein
MAACCRFFELGDSFVPVAPCSSGLQRVRVRLLMMPGDMPAHDKLLCVSGFCSTNFCSHCTVTATGKPLRPPALHFTSASAPALLLSFYDDLRRDEDVRAALLAAEAAHAALPSPFKPGAVWHRLAYLRVFSQLAVLDPLHVFDEGMYEHCLVVGRVCSLLS